MGIKEVKKQEAFVKKSKSENDEEIDDPFWFKDSGIKHMGNKMWVLMLATDRVYTVVSDLMKETGLVRNTVKNNLEKWVELGVMKKLSFNQCTNQENPPCKSCACRRDCKQNEFAYYFSDLGLNYLNFLSITFSKASSRFKIKKFWKNKRAYYDIDF